MVMLIGYSKTGFSKNVAHFGQSGIYFISSFFGGDVTLSARPDLPCIDEGTPGGIEFMTLVGVANVTPLHSRVYDHNVGPPA